MITHSNTRILVVDDNVDIHQDFIRILSPTNKESDNFKNLENKILDQDSQDNYNNKLVLPIFEIDTASQGQEAADKVAAAVKSNRPYAVAFVDIRMPPGWNGVETVKKMWQIDPDIQIVICTAYSDYSWENTVKHLGKNNWLILRKPFDTAVVRQFALSLTNEWNLLRHDEAKESKLNEIIQERNQILRQSVSNGNGEHNIKLLSVFSKLISTLLNQGKTS